jgi:phosphoesterase RecJ-like protein
VKKDFITNNKIDTNAFFEALKYIEKSRYILVVTHVNPDPDTISSALALSNYFAENRIKHKVYNRKLSDIPSRLNFINRFDKIIEVFPKVYDLIITVDCGTTGRVGFELPKDIPVINFDHHKSNNAFGNVNLVDVNKSSTAEVVYDFFRFNGLYITKETAQALYAGIYEDSIAFTTPRCDEFTYEKINFLVKCGADPSYIAQHLIQRDSLAKYRILPKIFESLELHCEGEVATIYCKPQWLQETGALLHETEVALDMILNMAIVKIAVYLRVQNDKVRISLRSKQKIDVSQIAETFGGGGHLNAAGCSLDTQDIFEAKEKILKEILETQKK